MTYNFFPFLFAQEKISLLAPEQEAVKSTLDSLKTARAEALAEKVQNLSNMSADQIISLLLEEAVKIGMKVLAAISIYIIGAWVIKKIKRIIQIFPMNHLLKIYGQRQTKNGKSVVLLHKF